MNIVSAAFSSYVLALAKNLYEKRTRKMLMKLTPADFILNEQHMPLSVGNVVNIAAQETGRKSCQKDVCTKNAHVKR